MDPITLTLALGAIDLVGNIFGGILGNEAAAEDRNKAEAAVNRALSELQGMPLPPDQAKDYIFKSLKDAGVYRPEMVKYEQLPASEFVKLTPESIYKTEVSDKIFQESLGREDFLQGYDAQKAADIYRQQQEANRQLLSDQLLQPLKQAPNEQARQAQVNALKQLQQMSTAGLAPQERAALNQVRQEIAGDVEAKRKQILQDLQQRGQASSGAALVSQIMAAEQGGLRASQEGDRLAALSAQRALEALKGSADLGASLEQADYQRARNLAEAQTGLAQNVAAQETALSRDTGSTTSEMQKARAAALQRLLENKADAAKFIAQTGIQREQNIADLVQKQAAAQDAINRFNTELAAKAKDYNVGQQNLAKSSQLETAQKDIERQMQYQKDVNAYKQQQYQNLVDQVQAKAAAQQGQAGYFQQRGQATAQNVAAIGQGVGQLGSSVLNTHVQNEMLKNILNPASAQTTNVATSNVTTSAPTKQ